VGAQFDVFRLALNFSRRSGVPIRLPVATWGQARPSRRSNRAFDLSCGVIGAAAIAAAVFIDWFCCDRTGAVLILVMPSGLIALLIRGSSRSQTD
jgi:hypothetical protein